MDKALLSFHLFLCGFWKAPQEDGTLAETALRLLLRLLGTESDDGMERRSAAPKHPEGSLTAARPSQSMAIYRT